MERAILMAAGMGTRMRPLTEHMPKPLIEVNGKSMIETVLNGLILRGVEEITVVTGYLADKFQILKEKYPELNIIVNPEYDNINNISSVYYARQMLRGADCFICEADLYVSDSSIFQSDLNDSCYYGKYIPGWSDDWVFDLNENGVITRVGKEGKDCYNMCGIAYFKQKDAEILADAIEKQYRVLGYENMFWDDVVNLNLDKLKLKVHPVKPEQLVEIDTVDELEIVRKIYG